MSMYSSTHHAEAMAARPGGYVSLPYDTQQPGRIQGDQCYGSGEVLMDNAEYYPSNGYYVAPQAPRLSAAAARASSMAAMYYNPTLHPLHPSNGNVGPMDPWASSYRTVEYGQPSNLAAAYHHQNVEDQLMAQNKRGYGNVAGYSAAATAYGQEQRQPEQHYPHRYSYPHDRSQRSQHLPIAQQSISAWGWKGRQDVQSMETFYRHHSDSTPTGNPLTQYNRGQSYFDPSKQSTNAAEYAPSSCSQPLSFANGPQQHGGQRDWSATQDGVSQGTNWTQGYANKNYHDAWQGQNCWEQGNEPPMYHRGHAESMPTASDAWVQPSHCQSMSQYQSSIAPSLAYQSHYQNCENTRNPYYAPQDQQRRDKGFREDHVKDQPIPTEQSKSSPSPPSPATLDKSAVPISGVGAEIIWSACVVFTEPEILASCIQGQRESLRGARGRTSKAFSSPSSAEESPYWGETDNVQTSTQLQSHHERKQRGNLKSLALHRTTMRKTGETAAGSEESSASSSEPGTPPSSFPAYVYEETAGLDCKEEKRRSISSAAQHFRELQLSPKDFSLPPLERRRTQDGVQEAVSSVLNLVSVDCQWSLHEDKFTSLSQSLREAAKANDQGSKRLSGTSYRMRSTSSNGMSPRGEEVQTINGAAAPGSEASPAFRRFAHQVLAQTLVSPTALILAMMYSLRVPYLAIQINKEGVAELDAEAREIFAQPPSAAPFKLFTLGLMIANKHLDDNTFLNKTWNEVTGISLLEINRMERWYLEKSSYEIAVPEEPWVAFLERLAIRTEGKLSRSSMTHPFANSAKTFKSLGGLSHEEALKRMLLSVEEALVVLGRLAPFDLTRQLQAASPPFGSEQQRHINASPSRIVTSHSGDSLQSLRNDCQSAPALSQVVSMDTDVDIFGDEIGPYRPQRNSMRSQLKNEKASLDLPFHRSHSDNAELPSWKQQQQLQYQGRSPSDAILQADRNVPLAPSVLLELLNRGQHLAHSALY